jgi:hypothetical protein
MRWRVQLGLFVAAWAIYDALHLEAQFLAALA